MAKQNGALIKETRKAAGMSQEALSKASGVSVKDISKVERGIEDLAPEKLEAVAKALDVTPESLILPEKPLTDDDVHEFAMTTDFVLHCVDWFDKRLKVQFMNCDAENDYVFYNIVSYYFGEDGNLRFRVEEA